VQITLIHLKTDKFWANQELIFDYKSSLTGTGNMSFVESSDIIDFFVSLFHIHLMGIEASAFTRFLQLCFACLLCFCKKMCHPIL